MKQNEIKHPTTSVNKFNSWLLSKNKDETQLLNSQEISAYLVALKSKIVVSEEENLYIIASILHLYRNQLNIEPSKEQTLIAIALNFVEKAQQEQTAKIENPHELVWRILFLACGKATVVNTIFRNILISETLVHCSYLDNIILWLASEETDRSQLLTKKQLQSALIESPTQLTDIENRFLVRSLVFNLRG